MGSPGRKEMRTQLDGRHSNQREWSRTSGSVACNDVPNAAFSKAFTLDPLSALVAALANGRTCRKRYSAMKWYEQH